MKGVKLNPDNTVDVTFDVNDRYQLTPPESRSCATRTWSATAILKSLPAQAICVKLPAGATSPRTTPSPRWTSTRCSVGSSPS